MNIIDRLSLDHKWNKRFLELAEHISQWSKDPRTKVGAVIVRPDRTIASVGYNGFPRGVKDKEDRYNDRTIKYPMVVHAELNAILNAKEPLNGTTIYVWPTLGHPPTCDRCAVAIIQAGIQYVLGYKDTGNPLREEQNGHIVTQMYKEAGIKTFLI